MLFCSSGADFKHKIYKDTHWYSHRNIICLLSVLTTKASQILYATDWSCPIDISL